MTLTQRLCHRSFQICKATVLLVAVLSGCQSPTTRSMHGVLSASTSYLNFGSVTLGLSSDREVVLAQEGLAAVELAAVRVEPPDGAFSISSMPARLLLGETAKLSLSYHPRLAGRNLTVMHVPQRNGEELQITLDGRGVDARAVPVDVLDFGRPAVGGARQRFLHLRNDAETAVPIRLVMTGPDASEFFITRDVVIPPFSEFGTNSWYHPVGRAGRRDVTIQLVACPLCLPEILPVRADAVAQPIVVTPDPVEMGDVAVDTQRRKPVQITNVTDEMITLFDVQLAAGTDPGFLLDPVSLPLSLLPLMPETVHVTFSPTSLAPAAGTLALRSDAVPTPELTVPMHAGAGGAQLVVTPQQLNFKKVPTGGRGLATFTVENGAADAASPPLHILGITVDRGPFDVAAGIPAGTALAAGERRVVTLGFAPPAVGDYEGAVTVTSDDPINPTVTLTLKGTGTANVTCELQVTPPSLDFGGVIVGKTAVLGAKVTNVGTGPCSLWDEVISGSPAFRIDKLRPLVTLNPNEGFVATIAFTPTAAGQVQGEVTFQTSRVAPVALTIPFTGGADTQACLVPDPLDIYFGANNLPACPANDRTASFFNRCTGPVTVTAVGFGPGTEADTFSIAATIPTPQTLPPGGRLDVPIHLDPIHPGYSVWPLFVTASDSPLPHLVPVAGEILANDPFAQEFVQTQPGRLDLLWVIDNTESMRNKRASLAGSVASFLNTLDSMGVDYQMGVTTTGIDPAPPANGTTACPGGVNGGEAGRLFPVDHSSPRIISSAMGNRAQVLATNIEVGGCHSIQQGLRAAELALLPPNVDNWDNPNTPEPADGNEGLVRTDASLAVVVVSDQDDSSPGSVDDNVQTLLGLKPATPMTFSAIVTPLQGCSSGTQPGTRYLAAADRIGGVTASVCDSNWSQSLDAIAHGVFRSRDTFPLAHPANVATLEVTVDGQPATGWRYDSVNRSVIFNTAPAPGTRIGVVYRSPCTP